MTSHYKRVYGHTHSHRGRGHWVVELLHFLNICEAEILCKGVRKDDGWIKWREKKKNVMIVTYFILSHQQILPYPHLWITRCVKFSLYRIHAVSSLLVKCGECVNRSCARDVEKETRRRSLTYIYIYKYMRKKGTVEAAGQGNFTRCSQG